MSKPSLISVQYIDGIYLPEVDLWLDPHRSKERAFVSHAHADHFARHEWTLCSKVTQELIADRYGEILAEKVLALDYQELTVLDNFELRLLPAGHIFGSAMLHIKRLSDGATLLYTGDFKLRHGLTAEPAELLPADTLILETTFGLPQYKFPPRQETIQNVLQFVRETLEDGGIPVLLGYSLGKAQEILAALSKSEFPVMLHPSMLKLTETYRRHHADFPSYLPFKAEAAKGHVLILPPSAARSHAVRRLKKCRFAMLSGWALTPGAKYRYQVDAVFPLSDHADYPELLQCVEETKPSRVFTVHGSTREFAQDLRERGYEAWSLIANDQLELGFARDRTPDVLDVSTSSVAIPDNSKRVDKGETETNARSFAAWSATCERVLKDGSRLKKQEHLAAFLQNLEHDEELTYAVRWFSGIVDDPIAGETPLQIGWAIVQRVLRDLSGLNEAEFRAISRSQNDTGRTAYIVLQRAETQRGNEPKRVATLTDIAAIFREIRVTRGALAKTAVLKNVLATLPSLEASYLVRLLTGELRVGSREGLVEEAVAQAFSQNADHVREAAMLSGDLGRAAVFAKHDMLHQALPTLFVPIKVMLASPEETADDIWTRLIKKDVEPSENVPVTNVPSNESVWLEDKFDGIRAQLHRSGDRVEIYTRDLKNVSAQFPEIIKTAQSLKDEMILDGEIIAYSEDKKLTFQDLQKRLGRRDQGDLFVPSDITVKYVVFDVLWLNGQSLLAEPLESRRKHLESITFRLNIQRLAVTEAASALEVEAAFHAARRAGNEGLIAKDRQSPYTPGRRGKTWLKLKKAFSTLDVVVVKAEQGHGKRSHMLSDYTFSVRDETSNKLKVIGKAYSGLTDVEIEELTEFFTEHTISQKGNVRTVKPNLVLEIAFDAIQPSTRHDSGLALRFPRIKAIRRDKTAKEIDTLSYAKQLAGLKVSE